MISYRIGFELFSYDCSFSLSDLDMPFAKWTKDQVCSWLVEQGLGSYLNSGKHWIASGQTLLQASQQDLEKVNASILFMCWRQRENVNIGLFYFPERKVSSASKYSAKSLSSLLCAYFISWT